MMCGGNVQENCWSKKSRGEKECKRLLYLRSLDVLICFCNKAALWGPGSDNLSKSAELSYCHKQACQRRKCWVDGLSFKLPLWNKSPRSRSGFILSKFQLFYLFFAPPQSSETPSKAILIMEKSWSGETVCGPPPLEKMCRAELWLVVDD